MDSYAHPAAEPHGGGAPEILFVADSDSYLKWAIRRMEDVPPEWTAELVVVRNAVTPSPEQQLAAIDGRLDPAAVNTVTIGQLAERLRARPPGVLFLACRGPLIETLLLDELRGSSAAPVIVAGIPGIWMPPTELGVDRRAAVDMMVVHSEHERELLRPMLPRRRLRHVALASLLAKDASVGSTERPCVLFAPQALVPRTLRERQDLLQALIDTAVAHPALDVVIKLRGTEGEAQTHQEFASFPSLAWALPAESQPPNLRFAYGPLRQYLGNCRGFVTVSSTAVIEAMQAGVPSLCLDDFGVSEDQINLVFAGSGLFGSLRGLRSLDFRHPDPVWKESNYFHDASADDWVGRAHTLWRERLAGASVTVPGRRGVRERVRGMRARAIALGPEDRMVRRVVWRATQWVRRAWRRAESWGKRAWR